MKTVITTLVLIGIGFFCLSKASDHFHTYRESIKKEHRPFARLFGVLALLVPGVVGPGGAVALFKCVLYFTALVLISTSILVVNGLLPIPS